MNVVRMLLFSFLLSHGGFFLISEQGVAGESPNAKVEVIQENNAGTTNLVFKVVPQNGLIINEEGPWMLQLSGSAELSKKIAKLKYPKSDFDFKVPGVKLSYSSSSKLEEEVDYSLTAFVCTADKARCYREVLKGKHRVKL